MGWILKAVSPRWWGFNLVGSWDISLAVKPNIMGVAGEHAMESFCLSQLQSKEGENCSPTKHLGLSRSGKQTARRSTPCQKKSQVWGKESERWPRYMYLQQRHQCWKWEEFWKTLVLCNLAICLCIMMFCYLLTQKPYTDIETLS